jgi:hypothetical protein
MRPFRILMLATCFFVGSVLLCSANNGTGSARFCARHCSDVSSCATTTTLDPPGDTTTTTTTLPSCGPGQCPDSCAFQCVDEATGTCNPNCETSREAAVYYERLALRLRELEATCGAYTAPDYRMCQVRVNKKTGTKYIKCPNPFVPARVLVPVKAPTYQP